MACTRPTIDICINEGATFEKDFVWLTNGVPVDLTGYTAEAHFRIQRDAPGTILEATTENGLIVIEPLEGRYGFRFDHEITSAMQRCQYDLFLIALSGHRLLRQGGAVKYNRAVTRGLP